MSDTRDRRTAARLPVDIPVDYLGKEFLGNGTVINVSPYGVLIRGDYLPIIGTNLSLRMFPPDDREPLSVERAVVRWQRGSELGLEIMTMTPEARARLNGIMTSVLKHRGCAIMLTGFATEEAAANALSFGGGRILGKGILALRIGRGIAAGACMSTVPVLAAASRSRIR